ncbi:MAG TPA: redoxin domain-containing protein [Methylomirabilota bacterium]|nr:redoxin domain-containing protein [Methylomirabilota bacterium]
MAAAIVFAAWWMGGRAGFDEIGSGGVNRKFLPRVGEVAPDMMALDVYQQPVLLSQFRGQPVWLTFWGSWCPPCRSEMPEIQQAYVSLAPQGVVLMAVSIDESMQESQEFAAVAGATFPILNVPERWLIAERGYDLYNVPTHIFIDAGGVVRTIIAGPVDEDSAMAAAETILAETAMRPAESG